MAARKFLNAHNRLSEQIIAQTAELEAGGKALCRMQGQILCVATRMAELERHCTSGSIALIRESVMAYMKFMFTLAETFGVVSTIAISWVKMKTREAKEECPYRWPNVWPGQGKRFLRLYALRSELWVLDTKEAQECGAEFVPTDLQVLQEICGAIQNMCRHCEHVLSTVPMKSFGRLVSQIIQSLTRHCTQLQDAPLFDAVFLRTIFEAITPLSKEDLEDFMLRQFYELLEECAKVDIEGLFAESFSSNYASYAECGALKWSKAAISSADNPTVGIGSESSSVPSSCNEEDNDGLHPLPSSLSPPLSPLVASSPISPKELPCVPLLFDSDEQRECCARLKRLQQFNLWPIWLLGCVLQLSMLQVSGLCTRLMATEHAQRPKVVLEEVQTCLSDPEFQALTKVAQLRSILDDCCTIPPDLQPSSLTGTPPLSPGK